MNNIGRRAMPSRQNKMLIGVSIGLVLAIGVAWICGLYRGDLEKARTRVMQSSLVQTRCGVIEYATVGQGPAVLLVHGAGGGFDQGIDFGKKIAERGFQIIAMSRFGYLRTPLPPDASPEAQADAHACLLDALGVSRAAIIGASAGAPSAMQFALRYPDRCAALVLVVPAAYVPREGDAPSLKTPGGTDFLFKTALKWDFLFWIAPKIARGFFVEAILATPKEVAYRANVEEQARLSEVIEHILPVSERRLGLLNDSIVVRSIRRYPLEDIHVRTLAISVADDLYGTYDAARYTAEHIPGARFVGYDTGGHLWVGHQQEVVFELNRFLRATDGDRLSP